MVSWTADIRTIESRSVALGTASSSARSGIHPSIPLSLQILTARPVTTGPRDLPTQILLSLPVRLHLLCILSSSHSLARRQGRRRSDSPSSPSTHRSFLQLLAQIALYLLARFRFCIRLYTFNCVCVCEDPNPGKGGKEKIGRKRKTRTRK